MTPTYQVLMSNEDPTPSLVRWRGGQASLWRYTVSHRVLEIRVQRESPNSCLRIYCGDVQSLCGPTKWNDCSFGVDRMSEDEIVLRDRNAGFDVRAGVVGVEESLQT